MRPFYRLFGALAFLLTAPLATAATITVNTLNDELNNDGDCSLREAIVSANTNASVDACASGASGRDNISFSITSTPTPALLMLTQQAMEVTEDLTINSGLGGGVTVVIDGADTYRIFAVTGGRFVLQNTVIQNARAERGAGIYIASGAEFSADDCVFRDNVATGVEATDGGAAVYNDGGDVTLVGVSLTGNAASGMSGSGGAVLNNAGTLTITESAFRDNSASRAGGAIEAAGASRTTITDTNFASNSAGSNPGNGGAFHISATGSATITGGVVNNNVATREGGGFWNNTGTMTITGTRFVGNVASGAAGDDGGGALFNNGGTMNVEGITAEGNVANGASGSGGGLMTLGGTLNVRASTLLGNVANRAGAGIESAGATTTVTGGMINGNVIPAASAAPGNGGGIHAGGGTLTIEGATLSGNQATEGGGVWASGGLVIRSSGGTATTISGNIGRGDDATNGGGGVYAETGADATIDGATISANQASGASGSGGGVFVASGASMDINGGTIADNRANRAGAGIENAGGDMIITGVTVLSNIIPAASAAPGNGGGLHAGGGSVTIRGGVFRSNEATEGGGLWSNGTLVIELTGGDSGDQTVIASNIGRGPAADNGGGGVYVESGGEASITSAVIEMNRASGASGSGGGILVASGASATVTGGSIRQNTANRAGAGVENAGGTMQMVNVSVRENVIPAATAAPGNGGGLHSGGGMITIRGGDFTANEATEGGGLWSNGTLVVGDEDDDAATTMITQNIGRGDDATNGGGGVYAETGGDIRLYDAMITDNVASGASGSGGGIFVADESIVVMNRGTVSGNRANRAGAGIEVADDGNSTAKTALVLTNVTVSDNSIATAAPGNGGGIHIGGSGVATIRSSTISGNTAREGAGVWVAGAGALDIALSTVSGNAATEDGGGLYDNGGDSSAEIMLQDVTVALNTAGGNGGGLLSESTDGASYTFANSIIGANTAASGADCFGMFESGGYNLIQNTSGCTINGETDTNVTGMSPMLGDLADNGGFTMTHLPMEGSPAVNAGSSSFDVDQRGFMRSVGQTDIGSVERGSMPVAGEEGPIALATDFSLLPTRPNPARGQATIAYTVAESAPVRVEMYNVLGQLVQTVYDGMGEAGSEQTISVDASRLAPGTYIVRLQSGDQQATRRMTVVR
ncbi:choice-of-anchor Q domain-containing protein [Rubricoccus marinus]|nr:right-handed parallel beta-helix repeat-containing protein [Rubricoccus marinus]